MFLGQVTTSVLYALKEGVDLFTNFSIYAIQAKNPPRFEVPPTQMAQSMKQVMPKSCVLK